MITYEKYGTFNGVEYDTRHGGPFDRGAADSYYDRGPMPHYFKGQTHFSEEVQEKDMTPDEIKAYYAGYDYNEKHGDKKDWG